MIAGEYCKIMNNKPDIKILYTVNVTSMMFDIEVITFPDGQTSVVIPELLVDHEAAEAQQAMIQVQCRIKSNNDFIVLLQVCEILTRARMRFEVYMPYLFAARSDRVFAPNRSHDLLVYVDTLARTALMEGYLDNITFYDVHNQNWFKTNIDYDFFTFLQPGYIPIVLKQMPDVNVVFPDAGAKNRYWQLVAAAKAKNVITMDKIRDEKGNIVSVGFSADDLNVLPSKDFIVVDDLCDGGATFKFAAKQIKEKFSKVNKLSLYVSHGVFSKGVDTLLEDYDHIYCTNSYQDIVHPNITQYKVI